MSSRLSKLLLVITITGPILFSLTGCSDAPTPEEYLANAKKHAQQGEVNAAAIELKNALKQAPEMGEARYLLSQIHLQQGRYEAARKELQRAEREKYQQDLWLGYARLYNATREFQQLLDDHPEAPLISSAHQDEYQLLLDLARYQNGQPLSERTAPASSPSPYFELYRALQQLMAEEYEAAQASVRSVTETAPDLYEAYTVMMLIGAKQAEVALVQEGLAGQVRVRPADFMSRALLVALLIEAEKVEEARPHAAQLLKRAPKQPLFNYYAAAIAFDDKQFDKARQHLDVTLGAFPQYIPARALAAVLAYERDDQEQARDYLAGFIDHVRADHPLQRLMVAIDAELGQVERATERMDMLSEPTEKDAPLLRFLASEMALQGNLEEGISLMEQVHQLEPQSSDIYALGRLHLAKGNAPRAAELLESTSAEGNEELARLKLLFVAHLKAQQISDAAAVVQEIRGSFPDEADGYTSLAVLALVDNDVDTARKMLDQALEVEADDAAASMLLYHLEATAGDMQAAKAWLLKSLEQHTTHPKMLNLLFRHDLQFGQLAQDLERFETAHAAQPDAEQPRIYLASALLASHQFERAQKLLTGPVANKPQVQPLLIRIHLARMDLDSALQTILRWREMEPGSQELLYWESKVRMLQGDWQLALELTQKLLAKTPELLDSQVDEALILFNMQRLQAFDQKISAVADRAGDDPRVLELQARRAWLQAQNDLALSKLERLHQLKPSSRSVVLLAEARQRTGDAKAAEQLLQSWLTTHPDDSAARISLASSMLTDGCSQAVIEQYDSVLTQQPESLVALNNQAWCLLQLKQHDKAREVASRAYQLYPKRPEILDTYGMILLEMDRSRQAMKLLEQAHELSDDPSIGYHTALAMSKNARIREAKELLRSLLATDKSFPERQDAERLLAQL